jgi:hypothetical protein
MYRLVWLLLVKDVQAPFRRFISKAPNIAI